MNIPIININDANLTKEQIYDEIKKGIKNYGFLYIFSDIINKDDIENILNVSKQYFDLEQDIKCNHIHPKNSARRGYSKTYSENFASLIGISNVSNDYVEKYRIGPMQRNIVTNNQEEIEMLSNSNKFTDTTQNNAIGKQADTYYETFEAMMHFTPNEYDLVPLKDFQSNVEAHYMRMERLAMDLLRVISIIYNLQDPELVNKTHMDTENECANYFASCMDKHTSIMALNCYENPMKKHKQNDENQSLKSMHSQLSKTTVPMSTSVKTLINDFSQREIVTTIRIAEHTDVSMLTLLCQSPPSTGCSYHSYDEATGVEVITNITSQLQIRVPAMHNSTLTPTESQTMHPIINVNDVSGSTNVPVSPESEWITVPYVAGGIIVNIGDCLHDWSMGELTSTLHRVVTVTTIDTIDHKKQLPLPMELTVDPCVDTDTFTNHHNADDEDSIVDAYSDRYSVAFFVSPNYDALMCWNTADKIVHNQHPSSHFVSNNASNASNNEPCSYSNWRKQHIKTSMKCLKQHALEIQKQQKILKKSKNNGKNKN